MHIPPGLKRRMGELKNTVFPPTDKKNRTEAKTDGQKKRIISNFNKAKETAATKISAKRDRISPDSKKAKILTFFLEIVKGKSPSEGPEPLNEVTFDQLKQMSHGTLNTEDVAALLKEQGSGAWLVRDSNTKPGEMTLSELTADGLIRHKRFAQDADLSEIADLLVNSSEKQVQKQAAAESTLAVGSVENPKQKTLSQLSSFVGKQMPFSQLNTLNVDREISMSMLCRSDDGKFALLQTKAGQSSFSTIVELSVDDNGRITSDTGDYPDFETFKKSLQLVQPPSEKEIENLMLQRDLAHAWGLEGKIQLRDGIYMEKTGSRHEISAKAIDDQLDDLEFPTHLDNEFTKPALKEAMRNALNGCIRLREIKGQVKNKEKTVADMRMEIVRQIESGEPVLIPTGISGAHAVYITYHNNILTITNRGDKSPETEFGTYYLSVKEDEFKSALEDDLFCRKIMGFMSRKEMYEFFPHGESSEMRGGILEKLETMELICIDKKSPQKVGNCTFANCIAAMHATACMKSLEKQPLNPGETLENRVDSLRVDYKAFTFAVRTKMLEKASDHFGPQHREFNQDLAQAVIKLNGKLAAFETAGKFRDVEERQQILGVCQYYSEKVNHVAHDNPSIQRRMEFLNTLASLHYPEVTKEEAEEALRTSPNKTWLVRASREPGKFTVTYKDDKGMISNHRMPSDIIDDMESFRKRLPKERQLSLGQLRPELKQKVRFYQALQSLSNGKISDTEVKIYLQNKPVGSWMVRESRQISGALVLSQVVESEGGTQVVNVRLVGDDLKQNINEFLEQHDIKKRIEIEEEEANLFQQVDLQEKDIARNGYVRLSDLQRPPKTASGKAASTISQDIRAEFKLTEPDLRKLMTFLKGLPLVPMELTELKQFREEVTGVEWADNVKKKTLLELDKEIFKRELDLLQKNGVDENQITISLMRPDVKDGVWFVRKSASRKDCFVLMIKEENEGESTIRQRLYQYDKQPDIIASLQKGKLPGAPEVTLDVPLDQSKFDPPYRGAVGQQSWLKTGP